MFNLLPPLFDIALRMPQVVAGKYMKEMSRVLLFAEFYTVNGRKMLR